MAQEQIFGWEGIVKIDGSVCGFANSMDLQVNGNSVTSTTYGNQGWVNRNAGGLLDATASTDGLMTTYDAAGESVDYHYLLNAIKTRKKVVLALIPKNASANTYEEGTFVIDNVGVSGSVDGDITYSASFSIDGSLNTKTL